ncbi:MAG TPA: undecaprenyldiphospho-muramoylpentapeptide beta-N-acetylglucosaminyltransferase [Burkholderiaceae bacterium]|nr:undecaprenyldiphospho-muramoylpentapeptide beta-N-acetylglucosaminyltransferase [Burkholderiaceae bacterium]
MRHLVVAAAGTGGHVMPGLAVAQALRERGWTVSWLGTAHGKERAWVTQRQIDFDALGFSAMRGKGPMAFVMGAVRMLRAVWQAWRVLRRRRCCVLFSTGGYVAVPAGWAAACARVPVVVLNGDAAPLLSTRLLRPVARAVLCGFEGAAAQWAGARGFVTGNPVRAEFERVPEPALRFAQREGALRVLVIGGSLGAQVLNTVVPEALALYQATAPVQVVHQCGAAHEQAAAAAYAKAAVEAQVLAFIDDMAERFAWADVVICRAGAMTVAELSAAGVAAILVPFVARTTDHQRSNAQWLAGHGAAIHLPQIDLSPGTLCAQLQALTRQRLLAMAQAARALAHRQATAQVADFIERVAALRVQEPQR